MIEWIEHTPKLFALKLNGLKTHPNYLLHKSSEHLIYLVAFMSKIEKSKQTKSIYHMM